MALQVIASPEVGIELVDQPIDVRDLEMERFRNQYFEEFFMETVDLVSVNATTSAPEESAVAKSEISNSQHKLATCMIRQAFPKPSVVNLFLNDKIIQTYQIDENLNIFTSNDEDQNLYDLNFDLILETEIVIEYAEELNSNFLKCSVNDGKEMYVSESEFSFEYGEVFCKYHCFFRIKNLISRHF